VLAAKGVADYQRFRVHLEIVDLEAERVLLAFFKSPWEAEVLVEVVEVAGAAGLLEHDVMEGDRAKSDVDDIYDKATPYPASGAGVGEGARVVVRILQICAE
jgi:hypothetical protein